MIYYQYITNFKDPKNQDSKVVLTRSCEDAEYATHFEETRILARQIMRQTCNGILPTFTANTSTLTLAQYNAIIKGPDDLEINPDIPIKEDYPIDGIEKNP